MNRFSQLILLMGIAMMSISCEKVTDVKYTIDNQSTSEVQIDGFNVIYSEEIEDSVESGFTKTIATWQKRGKELDFFEPSSMFGDDLVITNGEGDTLIRDYRTLSNWQSNIDDERTVASHHYVLVLSDSDF